MITRLTSFLVLLLLSFGAWAQSAAQTYQLRHGDRLQVSVWKEEALNREVRVLPDGSITFPLVGRVMVAGIPASEAENRIREGLKKYIADAVVSVVVLATEGNSVYVLGKVLKPGPVPLTSGDTTVLQVLSQAGGLDRFADADRITVLRKMGPGTPDETLRVRYGDLLKGRELDSNIVMRPGDTVVVP
ncbi:MAG: Polysaccharide biosynthesis/export protein [Ramlibacter sp.]|jgi:polysaccharide export outer membrane protein|nr:Polysaccharide biosynthesis/export protein [Ramlibacter sp.]